MSSMCDECKCTTYYNEDTELFSCENDCPCCNDPNYVSDEEKLFKVVAAVKDAYDALEEGSDSADLDYAAARLRGVLEDFKDYVKNEEE